MIQKSCLLKSNRTKLFLFILVTILYFFPTPIFSQDSSGPVLSAFSQDLNAVDITSGGVTLTIQITVTDSSAIANVSFINFFLYTASKSSIFAPKPW